jgi:cellulose synthase/poly-beta-1,6-N-acetylglucosamine synthase-like glycosyltransferase
MDITLVLVLQWSVYFISAYFCMFWLLAYLDDEEKAPKKNIKNWPLVTVAVPAMNEEKTIEKTLNSILALDYPADKIEIIIINDGSKDKTLEKIKPYLKNKNIQLIDHRKNKGKGASLNEAIRRAKGEYFVCLDADSEVHPATLKQLLRQFVTKNIAVVMPIMKVKNKGKLNLLQKFQWYEYIVNFFFKKMMSSLDCVHVAPGPFSVYRTQVIRDVGYFDEHNLTEDLEITVRMQKYNYKIIQSIDGVVYTNAMPTMLRFYRQRNRWFKGGLFNAVKYREMLFNPKWGDFGLIQLPILIISGLISLILLGTIVYELLKRYITYLAHMSAVSFDFSTFIRSFSFNFNLLDVGMATVLMMIIMVTISVLFLWLAAKYTKEKMFRYNPVLVFAFMFFYFFLLAVTWIGVSKDLIFGKVQKW